MKETVLITIKGGLIASIHATTDLHVVIIDEDNSKIGESAVSTPEIDGVLTYNEIINESEKQKS